MSYLYESSPGKQSSKKIASPSMSSADRSYVESPSRPSYHTSATMNALPPYSSPSRAKDEPSDPSPIKADASDPPSSSSRASTSKSKNAKDESKEDRKSAKRPREQYSCVECCELTPFQHKSLSVPAAIPLSSCKFVPLTCLPGSCRMSDSSTQSAESKSVTVASHATIASSAGFPSDVSLLLQRAFTPARGLPPRQRPPTAAASTATVSREPPPIFSSARLL